MHYMLCRVQAHLQACCLNRDDLNLALEPKGVKEDVTHLLPSSLPPCWGQGIASKTGVPQEEQALLLEAGYGVGCSSRTASAS
jgi:hypothetical protein